MISEYMFPCLPWLISFENEETLNSPQKSLIPEKMHSTTGKWSSKPIFRLYGFWLITYQPWVTGSHRRRSRWFMIPRCQIWWQKTPFCARNWAWKRLSKWPASCSRIWWQTLGSNKKGIGKLRSAPDFPIGAGRKHPRSLRRNRAEEVGMPFRRLGKTEQLMLGRMLQSWWKVGSLRTCLMSFMFPSNACNWRSCWNVNELQKRWCEIAEMCWNIIAI